MKQDWERKKLGDVCNFKSGTTIASKLEKAEGEIIYAKVGDMNLPGNEDFITVSSRYVDLKEINANQIIPKGSIIFPKRGGAIATNKKRRIIKPTIVDLNTMALVPSKIIDKDYLFFWFQQIDLSDLSNGTSILQINNYSFDDVLISFPKSLLEQQLIITFLDEAFASIAKAKANAEQNLKNAKELFESYLQSVFSTHEVGWEEKYIGEICDLMTGGTPSSNKHYYYEDGEIRWLVSGDVNMGEILDCDGRITKLGLANSNAKYLPINSILIALNGQGKTRGTVAMLRTKATCNQSLVSIYPKDIKKIIPEYIFYNFKVRYQEIRKITGDSGNDRRGLNMPLIKNIKISYPRSITKQKEYIEVFSNLSLECNKLEAIYQKKIADLEELKRSILQKAFNGELKGAELAPALLNTNKTK